MSRERDLEIALRDEISHIFSNDKFLNEGGNLVGIHSYKHSLPTQYYTGEERFAPYVISEVTSGSENLESNEVQVVFTICVCDGILQGEEGVNQNRHCEDDLFHIKHKIIDRFIKSDVLNNKYICNNEWKWALVDDNTEPMYYAGLSVKFSTANIETENGYNQNLL